MHRVDLGRPADSAEEHSIRHVIGVVPPEPFLGGEDAFSSQRRRCAVFCLAAWIGGLVISIVSLLS
jgi:hypothetical protein